MSEKKPYTLAPDALVDDLLDFCADVIRVRNVSRLLDGKAPLDLTPEQLAAAIITVDGERRRGAT